MTTIPSPNAVLYTEDMLTSDAATAIAQSGFTTVILGLFHVHDDGSLFYNDTLVSSSMYPVFQALKTTPGSTVKTVLFSIGGGNWVGHPASVSDSDYPCMKASWTSPAKGATTTSKQNILDLLANAKLDGLDLDYEPVTTPFDEDFIATVVNEISQEGYMVTAAPYQDMPSWVAVLKNTVIMNNGVIVGNRFSWWNLQLYGGAYYPSWADQLAGIASEIGMSSSATQAFLLPGFSLGCGDTPPGDEISGYKSSYPAINGGFIWYYTTIADCLESMANSILDAIENP
jgi:hypothetical protein